jgi:hypothetical protein
MTETSPDEDVLAVDCSVEFAEAPVRVQVKCTSQFAIRGRSASWPVEARWLRHWGASKVPVYLVLVIVEGSGDRWLMQQPGGTFQHAAAFWARVDKLSDAKSLQVPKNQRLTVATIVDWREECVAAFTHGAA